MRDSIDAVPQVARREPWNKGKLIGAKPPLRPKHVWAIRTKLQIAGRTRDLAMFNLAIDSKLRGCDVCSLKVENVAPHGHAVDRATVRRKKTGQPGLARFAVRSAPTPRRIKPNPVRAVPIPAAVEKQSKKREPPVSC